MQKEVLKKETEVANEKQLVEDLLNDDWNQRSQAEAALYNASQEAVPHLLDVIKQACTDKNRGARRISAWVIYKIGSRITNVQYRDAAVSALTGALKDPDERLRTNAAWGLSSVGGKSALPALQDACKDKSADVRDAASHALTQVSSRP